MNIVLRELKANLKSLIIWSISLSFAFLMMLSEFSAYYNNPEMADILDAMPPALLEAFGMNNANLTTISGYMSIAGVYINLMLAIYAIQLGHTLIAKEERSKTAGFLMSLPRQRREIIWSKVAAGLILCVIVMGVVYGTLVVGTVRYEPDADFYRFLSWLMVSSGIMTFVFFSLGMFFATVFRRYKVSSSVGLATVFALYIMSVIVGLSDKIAFLRHLTPFKYFEASQILHEMGIGTGYAIGTVVIALVLLVASFKLYEKRDLLI
ncbi:ABC transporter permease subunit [Fusibacter tunisiensis]|uniref:ABC-2 type transport system permease protein n=1 Tax=Fusibacter tunisiensis TaxID=1008308 RepID=A0ABS2MPR8_9FIRM|nr:ABC transporter permease subunit [Fusibacter tunisiensis]MBM7561378.1 ABC-2 type transport system permease protein [Fusibacter tunisiensis]